ncbi:MAG: alpha/beta fold hydrolase [Salinivirgaceae bacterium]
MAKLNYKHFGEGSPLIILHGLYGSSDNWVSIARELMSNFSVYLVDLRNHGASPHLPEHNYQVMVDDLLEFMNDKQLYSAIIMGHSMGGKVAMWFTSLFPERVKKLIVVDISPRSYSLSSGDAQVEQHQKILKGLLSIPLHTIENRKEVEELIKDSIDSERVGKFLIKNLHRNHDKSFQWKINVDVLYQNLPAVLIGLEGEEHNLAQFRGTVLFIKGGESHYIQPADEDLIRRCFQNVKIVTIPGASHWVHADAPETFLRELFRFIL